MSLNFFRIHFLYATTHTSIYVPTESYGTKIILPVKLNEERETNKYQVKRFITIFMVYLTAFDISDFIVFFFKWSGLLGKFTYRKILNRNILHERVLVG